MYVLKVHSWVCLVAEATWRGRDCGFHSRCCPVHRIQGKGAHIPWPQFVPANDVVGNTQQQVKDGGGWIIGPFLILSTDMRHPQQHYRPFPSQDSCPSPNPSLGCSSPISQEVLSKCLTSLTVKWAPSCRSKCSPCPWGWSSLGCTIQLGLTVLPWGLGLGTWCWDLVLVLMVVC